MKIFVVVLAAVVVLGCQAEHLRRSPYAKRYGFDMMENNRYNEPSRYGRSSMDHQRRYFSYQNAPRVPMPKPLKITKKTWYVQAPSRYHVTWHPQLGRHVQSNPWYSQGHRRYNPYYQPLDSESVAAKQPADAQSNDEEVPWWEKVFPDVDSDASDQPSDSQYGPYVEIASRSPPQHPDSDVQLHRGQPLDETYYLPYLQSFDSHPLDQHDDSKCAGEEQEDDSEFY